MDEFDDHVHDDHYAQIQHDIVRGLQTHFPTFSPTNLPFANEITTNNSSSTFSTIAVLIIFLLW